jgi:hypothetical protein
MSTKEKKIYKAKKERKNRKIIEEKKPKSTKHKQNQ